MLDKLTDQSIGFELVPVRQCVSPLKNAIPLPGKIRKGEFVQLSVFGSCDQLIQQCQTLIDFFSGDMQRRRQCNDVLVISAHIQNQAHFLALPVQIARQADFNHLVEQSLVRRKTVIGTDFGTKCKPRPSTSPISL